MISTFVLLTIVGGVCRLGLSWVVWRKLGVSLGLPPILALALVVLTGLPDIRSPISINLMSRYLLVNSKDIWVQLMSSLRGRARNQRFVF